MKTKMVHATMKIIWAQKWKKFPVVKMNRKNVF